MYYDQLLNEHPGEKHCYDIKHEEIYMANKVDNFMKHFVDTTDPTGTLIDDVTTNEVAEVCKSLPNKRAPGYDGIKCVKFGGYTLFEKLAKLYNIILSHNYVYTSWDETQRYHCEQSAQWCMEVQRSFAREVQWAV